MRSPRLRPQFAGLGLGIALVAATLGGCSHTPRVGADPLSTGQEQVGDLVAAARAVVGPNIDNPSAGLISPTRPCRKTVAGYSVGRAGTLRAEKFAFVLLEPIETVDPTDPLKPLPAELIKHRAANAANSARTAIVNLWESKGYEVDRSEESNPRFSRTRAHVSTDYEIMVTAFTDPVAVDNVVRPQIILYAVSACLEP